MICLVFEQGMDELQELLGSGDFDLFLSGWFFWCRARKLILQGSTESSAGQACFLPGGSGMHPKAFGEQA